MYRQFYVPLYCLCRRFFRNEHEAIESVNDGMLKVFENIGSYKEEKGKFFNWVYTIVRNTALDKFRRIAPVFQAHDLPELENNIPDMAPGNNPAKALEGKDMYKLLDELSAATRVVCTLFYMEGYTIKDIAEELTISTGTVKWHLSESRKKLKPIFERHLSE